MEEIDPFGDPGEYSEVAIMPTEQDPFGDPGEEIQANKPTEEIDPFGDPGVDVITNQVSERFDQAMEVVQEEQAKADPENWPSTMLKKAMPPAETIEQKAAQDAMIADRQAQENKLKDGMLERMGSLEEKPSALAGKTFIESAKPVPFLQELQKGIQESVAAGPSALLSRAGGEVGFDILQDKDIGKASATVQIAEHTGLPIREVRQHFEELAQNYSKEAGIKTELTTDQYLDMLMTGMIPISSAVFGPLQVAKGIAKFAVAKGAAETTLWPAAKMVYQKLTGEPVRYEVTRLTDLLPDKIKDLGTVAEFLLYGYGAKKIGNVLADPRVAGELAGIRFRILRALGVKQETALMPLTTEQIRAGFGNDVAEAARRSTKVYQEELAKRQQAEFKVSPETEVTQKPSKTVPKPKPSTLPAPEEKAPVKPGEVAKTPIGKDYERVISEEGGKFLGVTKGFKKKDGTRTPDLIQFRAPSGTTLAIPSDKITPDLIRSKIRNAEKTKIGKKNPKILYKIPEGIITTDEAKTLLWDYKEGEHPAYSVAREMRQEIAEGQAGFRWVNQPDQAGTIEETIAGYEPSTFPEYFKDKGYTKEQSLKVIDAFLENKPMTEKQQALFKELLDAKIEYARQEAKRYAEDERRTKEEIEKSGVPSEEIAKESVLTPIDEERLAIQQEGAFGTEGELGGETKPIGTGEGQERPEVIPGTEKPTYKKAEFGAPKTLKEQATEPTPLEQAFAESKQGKLFEETSTKPAAPGFEPPPETPAPGAIPGEIKDEEIIRRSRIIKDLSEKLNVPIREGKFRKAKNVAGIFKEAQKVIRVKRGGVGTVSHETGHLLLSNFKDLDKAVVKAKKELGPLDYKPSRKDPREGFSEYIRFFVTQGNRGKLLAPEFNKEFEAFLSRNPDIKAALDEARTDFEAWKEMPSTMKVKSQINFKADIPPVDLEKSFNSLYTAVIDELNPIERFVQLAKKEGLVFGPEADPYLLTRLYKGVSGKADYFLKRSTFDANLKDNGKPYSEILKPIKGQYKDFNTYLIARHVPEREARGKATGISVEDAKQAVIEYEKKYPHFKQVAEERKQFIDRFLKYLNGVGLVSGDTISALNKAYKNHVPLYRVFEKMAEKGFLGKEIGRFYNMIKRAKGSEREIIPPIESDIKNIYAGINAADKAIIARAIATLANQNSELGRLFEKVPEPMQKVATLNLEDLKELKDLGIDEELSGRMVDIFRPTTVRDSDHIIEVPVGGKKEYYQADPDLYKALMGLNQENAGIAIKILSYPARWLRAGATSFSPEFIFRNPIRDQWSAFVFSKFGYMPMVDLVRGIFSLVTKDKYYWNFQKYGGMQSMLAGLDRDYMSTTANELLQKNWKNNLNPLRLMQILSEATELGTRLGEFRKGIESGADPRLATYSGRRVTLDFARGGWATMQMNKITAFLRANINGLNRPFRAFKEDPSGFMGKCILGITLPSIALWLITKDDEEYKEFPRWMKDTHWLIPTGIKRDSIGSYPRNVIEAGLDPTITGKEGQVWIRIPKPFELGIVFGSIPERILEYIYTKNPKSFKGLGESLIGGSYTDPTSWIPTAAKSIIENLTNYSFFRKAPLESQGMERKLPEDRYNYFTTETAKGIGKLLGVSPIKVENLIQGWTAGAGMWVMKGIDTIMRGGKTKLPLTLEDAPLTKGFIAKEPIGSASQSVTDFYDNWEQVSQSYASYRELKSGDRDKFVKEHPEGAYYKQFYKASRDISSVRKQINQVLESDTTGEKKLEIIRTLGKRMTDIAKRANKMMERKNES